MALFTSYDAVGLKEDISDIITNISPTKTPFQTLIGREKVTQKFFQWQEDSLRAAGANAQAEGFDASFVTVAPTVMRNNVTQILAEASQVSGTMDVTSTYGRAKESAYQLAKSAAQVKRDLEIALVGNDQAVVTGSDGVARKMASYSEQLTVANNVVNMGGNTVVDEAHLLTALQNCYQNGAEPSTVMITPANSLTLAGFAKSGAGRGRQIYDNQPNNKTLVNAVDVYVSPFGDVKVILNRFQNGASLAPGTGHPWTLVLNPSMWVLATLRPWFREVLAKTGDSIKQMIVGEFSLKHKNFLASTLVVESSGAF
jgi:hypothetical protein